MERMHKTVVALEMKRSSSYSTSRSNRHAAVPATRIAHRQTALDFIIEASQRQNAAMAQELARHDTD
ncbi:hypothetical protein JG687_00008693 [Phytophthora cactorum]|uniref:Uncharacterized protein n=1 Tax=Phytophthora cactorum TaxID=29920 RepID=A0A8T1UE47_9STRA|nr:hypothetical protein JG687_00008693 [Phytophthora cactorum]